jgi:hypothetical protein
VYSSITLVSILPLFLQYALKTGKQENIVTPPRKCEPLLTVLLPPFGHATPLVGDRGFDMPFTFWTSDYLNIPEAHNSIS